MEIRPFVQKAVLCDLTLLFTTSLYSVKRA
jgi:hypothetical protein